MALAAPEPARRRAQIRRLARVCVALMLATIVLSAYLRLSQAGAPPAAASGVAEGLARLAHRIVATVFLGLAVALLVISHRPRPALRPEGPLALALLVLTLALAALGVVTRGATLPAVTLGNLLGGFVLLALSVRLAAPPTPPASTRPTLQLRRWAAVALLAVVLQAALGALISGAAAAQACGDWADCSRIAGQAGWDAQALNPWLAPDAAAAPGQPRGAWLHLLHRGGAALLLPLLAVVAWLALRLGRRATGLAIGALLLLQALLGLWMTASGLPLAAVLLHNLIAAALLALLARLV
ncbi:MAG: COX15/CtaA family protein [Proteobacteria bacterium]|nr:COX15/CtaA family protein [Pseudomonadota bacterium]